MKVNKERDLGTLDTFRREGLIVVKYNRQRRGASRMTVGLWSQSLGWKERLEQKESTQKELCS